MDHWLPHDQLGIQGYPLVSSNMASWKIPELSGGFLMKGKSLIKGLFSMFDLFDHRRLNPENVDDRFDMMASLMVVSYMV